MGIYLNLILQVPRLYHKIEDMGDFLADDSTRERKELVGKKAGMKEKDHGLWSKFRGCCSNDVVISCRARTFLKRDYFLPKILSTYDVP